MVGDLAERVVKQLDNLKPGEDTTVGKVTIGSNIHEGERTILLTFPENTNYNVLHRILGRSDLTRISRAGIVYLLQDMSMAAKEKNLMFTCRDEGYYRVRAIIKNYLTDMEIINR